MNNPAGGLFQIGDALHTADSSVALSLFPHFAEVFGYFRPTGSRRVAEVLRQGRGPIAGGGRRATIKEAGQPGPDPLLAAVGELQFEVVVDRMQGEYGVSCAVERVLCDRAR